MTAPSGTRLLGWATVVTLAATAVMGLVVSPADAIQKDAVRLLYIHVPTAWLAIYLSFGITTLASALWLWRRTRSDTWDLLAGASAEIGVLFIGLTLAVGSIWGRTTWGVWWTWDARLTLTLFADGLQLFFYVSRSEHRIARFVGCAAELRLSTLKFIFGFREAASDRCVFFAKFRDSLIRIAGR